MSFFSGLFKPDIEKLKNQKDVPGLIKALSYRKEVSIRIEAAQVLGEMAQPQAVPALIGALRDQSEFVRLAAAWALGEMNDVSAVEPLIALLGDQDLSVRGTAAGALSKLKDIRAVEPLMAILRDKETNVKVAAAAALGKIGDARAVEPLTAALREKDSAVREGAAEALGELGVPALQPLLAALGDHKLADDAAKALGKIGIPAIEPLIATFKDGDATIKANAAKAFTHIAVTIRTTPISTDANASNLVIAAQQLLDLTQAVDPLIKALQNDNLSVRVSVADALGAIGDPRAIEPLITLFDDADATVQLRAAGALALLGEAAVEPLVTLLNEGHAHQVLAALAFGYRGDARGLDALLEYVCSDNWNTLWTLAVIRAIKTIGDPAIRRLQDISRGRDKAGAKASTLLTMMRI